MISKDMYTLLCAIPKKPDEIYFRDLLKSFCENGKIHPTQAEYLLEEARKNTTCYVEATDYKLSQSYFSITEKGMEVIEEYERVERADSLNKKDLKPDLFGKAERIISFLKSVGIDVNIEWLSNLFK